VTRDRFVAGITVRLVVCVLGHGVTVRWPGEKRVGGAFVSRDANPDMRITVGVDGTEQATEALAETVERAREFGDDLTVAVYGGADQVEFVERQVRDRLEALEFDAPVHRLEGHPGGRLVERAERGEYDRIVLPGGTRSPLGKIRFDSTGEFVLMNAQTSVTLVR
jgi:nucleotide-binding universal stress UspA family protein